jgi:hypothetical protein
MMKKLLIIFVLLFAVNAQADTTIEYTIVGTNRDGVYVVAGGSPTYVRDTTPLIGEDKNIVGNVSAMDFVDIRSVFYFDLVTNWKAIPANQEIVAAYVSLYGHNLGLPGSGVKSSIYVRNDADDDNIITLSDYNTARENVVSGSVAWNDATISTTSYNNTPDIKSLIQVLADSGGVSTILVFIDPTTGCADPGTYSFYTGGESDELKRPKITITYREKTATAKRVPWRKIN